MIIYYFIFLICVLFLIIEYGSSKLPSNIIKRISPACGFIEEIEFPLGIVLFVISGYILIYTVLSSSMVNSLLSIIGLIIGFYLSLYKVLKGKNLLN